MNAVINTIQSIDLSILEWIQENLRTVWLDKIMPVITSLGEFGLIWILLAAVLLIFPKTRRWGLTIALALIAGLLIGEVTLKNLVCRVRPCNLPGVDWGPLLIPAPQSYSFPSGHTCSSFAAAFSLFFYHKKWGIAALVVAALIAFSRMYLLVHFPTDILGGLILGVLMSVLSYFVIKKVLSKSEQK